MLLSQRPQLKLKIKKYSSITILRRENLTWIRVCKCSYKLFQGHCDLIKTLGKASSRNCIIYIQLSQL